MVSADDNNRDESFPMKVLCPGCGSTYRLEGPDEFHCPHCGNHIIVSSDGTIEFRAKKEEKNIKLKEKGNSLPTEENLESTEKNHITEAEPLPSEEMLPEEVVEISLGGSKKSHLSERVEKMEEEKDEGEENASEKKESGMSLEKEEEESTVEKVENKGIAKESAVEKERKEKSGKAINRRVNQWFSETTPEKKALIAVIIAGILVISILTYALMPNEKFSVRMAPEKIGDRGTYDVSGRIYIYAENGLSTQNGVIQELDAHLNGDAIFQINSTTMVENGFGIEHRVLDKYLYQFVSLSGSAKIAGATTTLDDAGNIKTEDSSYIDLTSNATVMNKIWNHADIHILSFYQFTSTDWGIYYPISGSSYNLFDLRQRDYKEDEQGELAGGSLRWVGEKKEYIYKWNTLKLHITENNSGSSWRKLSGDVWVANQCSMPVKVHIHMKIDTTKLPQTERLLFSYLFPTGGTLEVDYTATMKDFSRGMEDIPWGTCTAVHFAEKRNGVEFDKNWNYTPPLRNNTISFDPNFSPQFASDYAIQESDGLNSYIDRHKNEVYVVDGKYSVFNGTESWQLIFGYRESGLSTQVDGYNITVNKKGENISVVDKGLEKINNPSNSRTDIAQAMNIADSEKIFGNLTLLHSLFDQGKIDFQGGTEFRMQNTYLHTGLALSSFNPILQNNLPAGYGYYLLKETKKGNEYRFTEGMIDSSNGRVIYEMDHVHTG